MAQHPQSQYEFRYQRVTLIKTESLGIGSYGAVCKAMCDDLPCAAKVLHPALFQFTTPGSISVIKKFERECRLLSAIKHPNIVQYLGMCQDPDSKLPVLLMELMDESLTHFLEQVHEPLPYHTEVNLCHDTTLALSYLHSNGIIHRDLSSNNLLLIAGSRAKVADFGMVKLCDVNHSTANLTPLTLCPGTVAYMSPEALGEPPVYNEMLDSFSFGVLCIQIMTRQFPAPGNRFNTIEINDPRAPSGRVQVEVSELERRRSHINLIGPSHPLLPVARSCLKNSDRKRPSCHELCGRISRLKASSKYTESVQQSTKPTQTADGESQRKEQQSQKFLDLQQQLHTQRKQLQGREQEIQQLRQQILELQRLLTATNDQLQTLQQHLTGENSQLEDKEAAIMIAARQQEIRELRKTLQSSEQMTVELQQNLLEKTNTIQHQQRQIQELQQQLRQRGGHGQKEVETSIGAASLGRIKLKWRDGGRAPCGMCGEVVAVDGSVAYFRIGDVHSNHVIVYLSTHSKWSELPDCPNYDFSLAIVNSLLTAIGGKTPTKYKVTNSLFSFTDNKWTSQFPPMPTKRCVTAVVCNGRSLVVAGGVGEKDKNLNTVEVMDTETLEWSTASSLPHPLTQASATLCGNQVYMLGGWDQSDERSKSVFTCSLAALLQSCQPQSLGARMKALSIASRVTVWHKLADSPVTLSTCASLHGQLLTVGGCDSDDNRTTAVYAYNTITNSWEVISHMSTPQYRCQVAVLPHNKLMVVGGGSSIEFASIV